MNQGDIFASAQAITRHPVLKEQPEVQCQYYSYLKELIEYINQQISTYFKRGNQEETQKQNYAKAQLELYKGILCGESAERPKRQDYNAICQYVDFLPFDIASIYGYDVETEFNARNDMIRRIVSDFRLSPEKERTLRQEFSAAMGNGGKWDIIMRRAQFKPLVEHMQLLWDSISFIREKPYTILITATMSAGKSTIINALAGKNINLTQNMVATSKIHTILSKPFDDGLTTKRDARITFNASTSELMTDDIENKTTKILVSTYFNGSLGGQRVTVYDSPGVNSSENQHHSEITQKIIAEKKHKLLIYVLNGTQLGTDDDARHLEFTHKTLEEAKIIFLMNKMDNLISEDEDVIEVISRQRDFLIEKGFKAPVICPVSARAAYLVKKSKHESISRLERREMEAYMDKFAANSLSGYYTDVLGCDPLPASNSEEAMLFIDCGFAYIERIIEHVKKFDTFPKALQNKLTVIDPLSPFRGIGLDWVQTQLAFAHAKARGHDWVLERTIMNGDVDVSEKTVQAITDFLKASPTKSKTNKNLNGQILPVHFVSAASSGKSTLINALLRKNLIPCNGDGCNAQITKILDNAKPIYIAVAYDKNSNIIRKIPSLTYEAMRKASSDINVHSICAEGNIPILDSGNVALMLTDTSGSYIRHSSWDITSNSPVIYVLDASRLYRADDYSLLHYIAEQMKLGGQRSHDRILFVINKMDKLDPHGANIGKVLEAIKNYLQYNFGIANPRLFPCSAYVAFIIRTELSNIDIRNLTMRKKYNLSEETYYTLNVINTLIEYKSMHLENYSLLPANARQSLNQRLDQAVKRGDIKEQALIHSGICSVEAAVADYVKQFYNTSKIVGRA